MIRLPSVLPLIVSLAMGCEAPGVGDPCTPERIKPDGFRDAEVSIESRSAQCRTRVCLVNHLEGDPRVQVPCGDPGADTTCVREDNEGGCAVRRCDGFVSTQELEDHVYCSCKCGGDESDTVRCECPEGFQCCPGFAYGPVGLRGSYCVREGTCRDRIVEEDR